MMKKKLALIMTVVLVISLMTTVMANAAIRLPDLPFASGYITFNDAYVESPSTGKVTVHFSVTANDVMTKLGAKTIVLQERASAADAWGEYATYSYEDYDNMLNSKVMTYKSSITDNVKSGYQYRAKVYFYAEKGGYDTDTFITDYVKAK